MKLPKSIQIKGTRYKLMPTDKLDHATIGNTNEHDKVIEYDDTLKGESLKRCVLHEIGHAIMYETGIAQALNENMQEVVTENFANVIDDLLQWRFK